MVIDDDDAFFLRLINNDWQFVYVHDYTLVPYQYLFRGG